MDTAPPDLSVIILTCNNRDLTLDCVASVQAEAGAVALETIVVDNASTDGTIEALRAAYPQVRLVVNSSNLGFSLANNLGLAIARGRYLLLLNSDTVVRPGALAALVAFMDQHPRAGACGPQLLNADGSLQPSGRKLPTVWSVFADMTRLYRLWQPDVFRQARRDYGQVARVQEVSGSAMLVTRSAYERTGGLDANLFIFYEDVDWCHRIHDLGYEIYYVPQAQVVHLWHGTTTTRQVSALAYRAGQDSLRYYFCKHHSPLAGLAVQALLVGKELALLGAAAARRSRERWAFHAPMLRRALAPLQRRAPGTPP
jgi:GT2 family glycosyltransferase